jgi:hypothetical protein
MLSRYRKAHSKQSGPNFHFMKEAVVKRIVTKLAPNTPAFRIEQRMTAGQEKI